MLTWTEALALLPADEAKYPDVVCRGCAGMGYGGAHVTPRVAQFLDRASWRFLPDPDRPLGERYVRLGVFRYRGRGVCVAPFAVVLDLCDGLSATGWKHDPHNPPAPERAWVCPWCHGTGERTLSLHTLTTGAKP